MGTKTYTFRASQQVLQWANFTVRADSYEEAERKLRAGEYDEMDHDACTETGDQWECFHAPVVDDAMTKADYAEIPDDEDVNIVIGGA